MITPWHKQFSLAHVNNSILEMTGHPSTTESSWGSFYSEIWNMSWPKYAFCLFCIMFIPNALLKSKKFTKINKWRAIFELFLIIMKSMHVTLYLDQFPFQRYLTAYNDDSKIKIYIDWHLDFSIYVCTYISINFSNNKI